MLAAEHRYPDVVQRLLARGADTYAKTLSGETALMVAAENGELEIVEVLLNKART